MWLAAKIQPVFVTVQIVTLLTGDQEFDSAKTLAAFALGAMLFLAPGLPPTPFLVSYVPVANIEELTQTIGGGGNTVLRPVEGETDRYELVGGDNEQQIVLKGGYAFISQNAENLDQRFLDPAKLTKVFVVMPVTADLLGGATN